MYLSVCCDAVIVSEIIGEGEDAVGICLKCKEWMPFYDDEESVDKENLSDNSDLHKGEGWK